MSSCLTVVPTEIQLGKKPAKTRFTNTIKVSSSRCSSESVTVSVSVPPKDKDWIRPIPDLFDLPRSKPKEITLSGHFPSKVGPFDTIVTITPLETEPGAKSKASVRGQVLKTKPKPHLSVHPTDIDLGEKDKDTSYERKVHIKNNLDHKIAISVLVPEDAGWIAVTPADDFKLGGGQGADITLSGEFPLTPGLEFETVIEIIATNSDPSQAAVRVHGKVKWEPILFVKNLWPQRWII